VPVPIISWRDAGSTTCPQPSALADCGSGLSPYRQDGLRRDRSVEAIREPLVCAVSDRNFSHVVRAEQLAESARSTTGETGELTFVTVVLGVVALEAPIDDRSAVAIR